MSTKAGRREWIGLAVIALPCMLYSMDLTVLDLAIPSLSAALHPSSTQLLWIVDIYGFVLAALLVPMGVLGDRIGRRRLLLIGAGAFSLASICAALAPSAGALIAARAALGVAGATLAPSTLSLIRNMFLDATERTQAFGVWAMSYSIGGAIGPLVGGVLLEHFWWGSVFLISVPVMLVLLAAAPSLLPEFRSSTTRDIDVRSVVLSLTAVLSLIYGVKQLAVAGAPRVAALSIAAGAFCSVLFVRRQRRARDPMIDLGLFRTRSFSVSLAAYALVTGLSFGVFLFIGQFMQMVKGLSPLHAAIASIPLFAGFASGSFVAPMLAQPFTRTAVMVVGLAVTALGFILLGLAGPSTPLPLVAAAMAMYAVGLSPVVTLSTDVMVGAAPPERAGAASAISETGSELGGALGIALLGSLGAVVYRSAMGRTMPSGIPLDVAIEARNTIGGAIAASAQLPPALRDALADAARTSFSHSLNVVAWVAVAAAVMLAAAIAATRAEP